MRRSLVIALLAVMTSAGCAGGLGRISENRRAERLAEEKGRVATLADPVQKTRSYIVISQILLDFSSAAARDSDQEAVRGLLTEYTATVRSAVDTMSTSNRDALRRPAGYKELEVSLRRQVRQLQDMSQVLTFDERSPVESALQNTVAAREKLLQLLFPHPSI